MLSPLKRPAMCRPPSVFCASPSRVAGGVEVPVQWASSQWAPTLYARKPFPTFASLNYSHRQRQQPVSWPAGRGDGGGRGGSRRSVGACLSTARLPRRHQPPPGPRARRRAPACRCAAAAVAPACPAGPSGSARQHGRHGRQPRENSHFPAAGRTKLPWRWLKPYNGVPTKRPPQKNGSTPPAQTTTARVHS